MKFAVIVFPGSNCDSDCVKAVTQTVGQPVDYVFHTESDLSMYDCIILPGGFSYGDYLRSGAIAKLSSVMKEVSKAAIEGKYILGICNGFQILTECKLLPGLLLRNRALKFCCQDTILEVHNNETPFTRDYQKGDKIHIPIAHGEGNYYCDKETLEKLKNNNQIVLRYVQNPNGSLFDIAAVCNENFNVVGMMPHPERAVQDFMESTDGIKIFTSIFRTWRERYDRAAICK